jgi:imidazolonepropionase-like amidohydrolase
MVQAGLTTMQTLVASTSNVAKFLHAPDLGTLEPGKWADLLVLDANPLDDIKNTRKIDSVYIAGNRVSDK